MCICHNLEEKLFNNTSEIYPQAGYSGDCGLNPNCWGRTIHCRWSAIWWGKTIQLCSYHPRLEVGQMAGNMKNLDHQGKPYLVMHWGVCEILSKKQFVDNHHEALQWLQCFWVTSCLFFALSICFKIMPKTFYPLGHSTLCHMV